MREFKKQSRLELWLWRKFRSGQAQVFRFSKSLGRLTRLTAKGQTQKSDNGEAHMVKSTPNCNASDQESSPPYRVSFLLSATSLTTHRMCCLHRGTSHTKPTGFTGDNSFGHTLPEYTKIPDSCYQAHSLYSSVGTDNLSLVLWKDGETLSKYCVCRHQPGAATLTLLRRSKSG